MRAPRARRPLYFLSLPEDLHMGNLSPYLRFDRASWSALRNGMPQPLTEQDLERLRGVESAVSLEEVEAIYLPLSRLLNLYVTAAQELYRETSRFLGHPAARVPYVIGLAGSVAAGKSTTARVLQALLKRWPNSPRVDLVTTDGFLYPNEELERRGLMERKGFPESYDQGRLLRFVSELKAGAARVTSPVYSHISYDIVPGAELVIEQPEIVILEGLNVLQSPKESSPSKVFVSDFFDFSIYVDADAKDLERWYLSRFLKLRDSAFQNPESYFHRYASLTDEEAERFAMGIWARINGPNLLENVLPTRERAALILKKGADHAIDEIFLRKL
jgi:type I pantothenate kinase